MAVNNSNFIRAICIPTTLLPLPKARVWGHSQSPNRSRRMCTHIHVLYTRTGMAWRNRGLRPIIARVSFRPQFSILSRIVSKLPMFASRMRQARIWDCRWMTDCYHRQTNMPDVGIAYSFPLLRTEQRSSDIVGGGNSIWNRWKWPKWGIPITTLPMGREIELLACHSEDSERKDRI